MKTGSDITPPSRIVVLVEGIDLRLPVCPDGRTNATLFGELGLDDGEPGLELVGLDPGVVDPERFIDDPPAIGSNSIFARAMIVWETLTSPSADSDWTSSASGGKRSVGGRPRDVSAERNWSTLSDAERASGRKDGRSGG